MVHFARNILENYDRLTNKQMNFWVNWDFTLSIRVGSGSGSGFFLDPDPDPVEKKNLDPDPVCHRRLDPDPVNIRPDPQLSGGQGKARTEICVLSHSTQINLP